MSMSMADKSKQTIKTIVIRSFWSVDKCCEVMREVAQAVLIEAGGAGGWRPLTEEPGPGPQLLLWLVVSGQRDGMEVT